MSIIQFALTSHHRFVDILDCQQLVLSHRQHVLIWAWKNAAARKELPYQFFFFTVAENTTGCFDLRYFSALGQNPTKRVKQKFISLWVRPSKDSLEFQIWLCFESFFPAFCFFGLLSTAIGGVFCPLLDFGFLYGLYRWLLAPRLPFPVSPSPLPVPVGIEKKIRARSGIICGTVQSSRPLYCMDQSYFRFLFWLAGKSK